MDLQRIQRVITEQIEIPVEVLRRRINTGDGWHNAPGNTVYGIAIFCAEKHQRMVVHALAKYYPLDNSRRGLDHKDMCFVPSYKCYANINSVERVKTLRGKQHDFERSIEVTKTDDIEELDQKLDVAGQRFAT